MYGCSIRLPVLYSWRRASYAVSRWVTSWSFVMVFKATFAHVFLLRPKYTTPALPPPIRSATVYVVGRAASARASGVQLGLYQNLHAVRTVSIIVTGKTAGKSLTSRRCLRFDIGRGDQVSMSDGCGPPPSRLDRLIVYEDANLARITKLRRSQLFGSIPAKLDLGVTWTRLQQL
jgi:hypothetical protein